MLTCAHITLTAACFFSNRPMLKKRVREVESLVRTATVFNAVTGAFSPNTTKDVSQGLALNYHHDAITGTCTDSVARDYGSILDRVHSSADMHINSAAHHVGPMASAEPRPRRPRNHCKQLAASSKSDGGDDGGTFACRLGQSQSIARSWSDAYITILTSFSACFPMCVLLSLLAGIQKHRI